MTDRTEQNTFTEIQLENNENHMFTSAAYKFSQQVFCTYFFYFE